MFDGSIHYLSGPGSGVYRRFYEELGAMQDRPVVDHEELHRVEGTGGKTWIIHAASRFSTHRWRSPWNIWDRLT